MNRPNEIATLGGGCFWCLEEPYQQLTGVQQVTSGYAGGHTPDPTYRQVTSGTTGHAEVVQITYNPEVITYRDLLEVFFTLHDPTTKNRQGADIGAQYRSIILHHNSKQKETAEEVIEQFQDVWSDPIVTEVAPLTDFYPAEEYHQNYYRKNPSQPYCQAVVAPKIAKLRKQFRERLKG